MPPPGTRGGSRRERRLACAYAAAEPIGETALPRGGGLAVHGLGALARARRDAVLVQPGALAQRVAGLLASRVVGGSQPVDLPRIALQPRADPQPHAGCA